MRPVLCGWGERIRKLDQQLEYPWQLPQGGLDEGEDPRDAVFRELEEETGTANAEIIAETPGWLSYDLPAEVRDKVWKGRFAASARNGSPCGFSARMMSLI